MLDHLNEVSVFSRSALALLVILGIDFAFSLVHTIQEWRGEEVPLWRNFGAIVGVRIPHKLGFALFTVGLTAALWIIGLMAITGGLIVVQVPLPWAIGALGALVGARISDTLVSHVLLWALGYRPNPGLSSTPLYIVEAIFLVVAFRAGFALEPSAAWIGFAIGFLFFCFVLPAIWLLRLVRPQWRRERWIRGNPLPEWTKEDQIGA